MLQLGGLGWLAGQHDACLWTMRPCWSGEVLRSRLKDHRCTSSDASPSRAASHIIHHRELYGHLALRGVRGHDHDDGRVGQNGRFFGIQAATLAATVQRIAILLVRSWPRLSDRPSI